LSKTLYMGLMWFLLFFVFDKLHIHSASLEPMTSPST
jgi:hypothetical protein